MLPPTLCTVLPFPYRSSPVPLPFSTEPSNNTYHTFIYLAINMPAALYPPMCVPSSPLRAMWRRMGLPHWASACKVMSREDGSAFQLIAHDSTS